MLLASIDGLVVVPQADGVARGLGAARFRDRPRPTDWREPDWICYTPPITWASLYRNWGILP